MEPQSIENRLLTEIAELKRQVEEYQEVITAIREGSVDAIATKMDGKPNVFTFDNTDFIYRVLVENLPEGALNVSDKGFIIYANPAFHDLIGCTDGSIIGMEFSSLIDPLHLHLFERLFKAAFSSTSKAEITLVYKDLKKEVYISLNTLFPRFEGIGINIVDLSAKKIQEAQISDYKNKLSKQDEELLQGEIHRKSIERFRFMGDKMPQKVWTADADGHMDYFNKKWLDYTQLPIEELKKASWNRVIHQEDLIETNRKWASSVKSGKRFEVEHRIMNGQGEFRWHLSRGSPQMDNDNISMWVGTTTDVHIQKNFSDDLGKQVDEATVFLKTIFDSSEELITSFDSELNFTSINKVAATYINTEPGKVIGKNLLHVLPFIKNSKQFETINRVMKGEIVHTKEIVNIKGANIVFDSYCKPLIINEEVKGILIVARDITELINVTNSLQSAKQLLENHSRSIEEKNNELTNANAELRSFTYIASHDLKEPLRKIMVFASRIMVQEKQNFSEETLKFFSRINASVTHMQNLIDALLSYSKINDNQFTLEDTDLNEIVEDVKAELHELIQDNSAVINHSGLPTLSIVPFQFSQLFNNLISNSIKYSHKKVTPVITISALIVDAREIYTDQPLTKLKYWRISVGDNGIGFEQTYQFKIFELFQRLHGKEEFPGTGIGLAICNKVVQNHNGYITAVGKPGVGAIFNIYLPINDVIDENKRIVSSDTKE